MWNPNNAAVFSLLNWVFQSHTCSLDWRSVFEKLIQLHLFIGEFTQSWKEYYNHYHLTPQKLHDLNGSLSLSLKNWRPSYPVIFLKKNRTISYQFSISMLDLSQAHLTNWHLQSAWCYGVTWEDSPKKAETCVWLEKQCSDFENLTPPEVWHEQPLKSYRIPKGKQSFFRGRSVKLRRCISSY